jgi:plasmid stability protein
MVPVMNITLKDIPKDLHERLRATADRAGRSLNKQILFTLERAVSPKKTNRVALLKRIQWRRGEMSHWIDDESLQDAINDGRE